MGRPKGSKNVKKMDFSKQDVKSKVKEDIGLGDGSVGLCDIKAEVDDLLLTEKVVETVLTDIEPGEIVSETKYVEEELQQESSPSLRTNYGINKKCGRSKGSRNASKCVKIKKKHKCDLCGLKFKTVSRMKNHVTVVHERRKPECPHCDYEYQDMIKLERHINNHTGNRPHACDQCDYKSLTKHELRRHKNYKHIQTKRHSYPDCGKGFVEHSHLRRHMLIHSGERPWSCNHCHLVFQNKFHVERHERVHTGEKSYICPTCEQGFTQQGSLKNHVMTQHKSPEEQERFSCNFFVILQKF